MTKTLPALLALAALTGCGTYDCQYRGLSVENRSSEDFSCEEFIAAVDCWERVVGGRAARVLDLPILIRWDDEIHLDGRDYNGLSYIQSLAMRVKAISPIISQTALFHELGHFLEQIETGDTNNDHSNVAFWRRVENTPVTQCTMEYIDENFVTKPGPEGTSWSAKPLTCWSNITLCGAAFSS